MITFAADGTFAIKQAVQQFVDGVLVVSALQQGTGALTMDFDDSFDPGLTDGACTFAFPTDYRACESQPATIPFPLEFQRVD